MALWLGLPIRVEFPEREARHKHSPARECWGRRAFIRRVRQDGTKRVMAFGWCLPIRVEFPEREARHKHSPARECWGRQALIARVRQDGTKRVTGISFDGFGLAAVLRRP